MKKGGYMRDALVLFVITLISGLLLGGAYQITKEPIAQADLKAKMDAYGTVFPDAAGFAEVDGIEEIKASCNEELSSQNFGIVGVDDALMAVDANGAVLGCVAAAYSDDSYGGRVKLSVGIKADGTLNDIAFLEISDTPGLGLKAKEPEFKDQYKGKKADSLTVTKSGKPGGSEIDAISGATITSSAVTNAVNAALYFANHSIDMEAAK